MEQNGIKNQIERYSNLMLFFIIEHFVLIVFVILGLIYSPIPKWVKIFHSRRDYKQKSNRWIALLKGIEDENN